MRYTDPETAIQVATGEEFSIVLAGNPTTGYTWQVNTDGRHLELLDQSFERSAEHVGAGGFEIFRFRALETGETEITCEYRRPWEEEILESKRFRVTAAGQVGLT
jgi:inhibitor of cysteine peptidase